MQETEKEKMRKRRGQVIPRGGNTFLIRVATHRDRVTGRRVYHNETFHGTPAKAEKRCLQIVAQVDDGSFFQPSNMSVNELCDKWAAHCERQCNRGEIRKVTLNLYKEKLRIYVRPRIGTVPINPRYLTPVVMQDLFNDLEDKRLASLTIRNLRSVTSRMFKFAVGLKLLKENPLGGLHTPKAKRKTPALALNEEQAARLVEKAREDEENGLKFILWLYTGLRPTEFIGLRWRYLELYEEETEDGLIEFGIVKVRETVVRVAGYPWEFCKPKTDKGVRDIFIPSWLYHDLMKHKALQEIQKRAYGQGYKDNDLVFACRNGSPLHRANIAARQLKPLLEKAGLDQSFSLYTLRRSFASLLRRAGVSPKEVSEQMGHLSTSFTDDVYVTVFDSAKREIVGALEKVLFKEPSTHLAHTESERVM